MGRVFPKEAPNWEPVRAGEDGKRLGGKIGNDAQISPAVLLEIRPGQSRIDIPASLAAEPLIVEVEFSVISEFQHHAVGFSGDRSIGVQAENVFPPIAGGTQVFQVKAHGGTAAERGVIIAGSVIEGTVPVGGGYLCSFRSSFPGIDRGSRLGHACRCQ